MLYVVSPTLQGRNGGRDFLLASQSRKKGSNRTVQEENRNPMGFEGKAIVICSVSENTEGKRCAGATCLLAELGRQVFVGNKLHFHSQRLARVCVSHRSKRAWSRF